MAELIREKHWPVQGMFSVVWISLACWCHAAEMWRVSLWWKFVCGWWVEAEEALRLENLDFPECQLPSPCWVSQYKESVSAQVKEGEECFPGGYLTLPSGVTCSWHGVREGFLLIRELLYEVQHYCCDACLGNPSSSGGQCGWSLASGEKSGCLCWTPPVCGGRGDGYDHHLLCSQNRPRRAFSVLSSRQGWAMLATHPTRALPPRRPSTFEWQKRFT